MAATIIHLQQQLIQVLQLVVLSDNNGVDIGRLQNVSDRSRRLATAVPLSTVLRALPLISPPSTAYCIQAVKAQDRYRRKDWGPRIGAVCESCGWKVPVTLSHDAFLAEWHFFCSHLSDPQNTRRHRCFHTRENGLTTGHNCQSTTSMTGDELLKHMRDTHGFRDYTL